MSTDYFTLYISTFILLFFFILFFVWADKKEGKHNWHSPNWFVATVCSGSLTSIVILIAEGLYIWILVPVFFYIGFLLWDASKWKSERFNSILFNSEAILYEENSDGYTGNRIRKGIPQDVKDKVWNRDGGKCVQCGSNENIEFDHIIPHSKGGADTYRNLQILCAPCNRSKSNKIG